MPSNRLDLDANSLRDLVDGVSDLVQSVSPEGRIRFVNKCWLQRLGYTQEEIEGRNIFEFIHPESREHCLVFLHRLFAGEQIGVMETVFVTKSGEPVHLEGKVTVAFENGLPSWTCGVFREVSAERSENSTVIRLREQRRMFHSVLSILRGNTNRRRSEFLSLVTEQIAKAMGVARASVWLFDEGHTSLSCAHCYSEHAEASARGKCDTKLFRRDHEAYFRAVELRIPVRAEDAHTHPDKQTFSDDYLTPLGIRSTLDLPLALGDEVYGVLCCEQVGRKRAWTRDEEEFGMTVAAIVLIYLENGRRVLAERKLQQLNLRLEQRVEERTRQIAAVEQRLGYVMTSVAAVVFACEAKGNFRNTFVSQNIERQLGYAAQAYIDNPEFWREHLHPDDYPHAYDAMRRALADGRATYEYRFRLPDGSYRWFRDDYTLMRDVDGKPLEIVGSCVDIHDQRVAEHAAQSAADDIHRLIETANAPIFGKDREHRINVWNACAERITGYARNEALGRNLSEFAVDGRRDAIAEVFESAMQGRDTANFEFSLRAKDGRVVHLLLSASPRRDADGAIVGVVGVGQDITEHREAQRRSLRAQRLESIGTLAGGVAHDVNNSLAPILLAAGLFRERHPESSDLVDIVESSARRGASMVQQLLTFARGVDGKRVPVRPQILLAEIEQIVKSTFPKNIEISASCAPDAPAVLGDSTQLHQVLLNLCVNARDAMPRGGTLTVEIGHEELTTDRLHETGGAEAGRYVRICITDTGCGIEPELVDRIFEPFFSTKSPEQGTGLGLSTTIGIVRSHGGFMRVHSRIPGGSTFTVYLPARFEHAPAVEIPRPARQEFHGNGETVLLVDDEPMVRNVMLRLLTRLGFDVMAAADAETALTVLRDPQKRVSLVITDLHMPGTDGLALTREIRSFDKSLPVVLASGFSDQADPAEVAELEFAAQLDKPFTMDSLVETLRSALAANATRGATL